MIRQTCTHAAMPVAATLLLTAALSAGAQTLGSPDLEGLGAASALGGGSAEVRLDANRQVLVPVLPPPPAGEDETELPSRLLRIQTLNPWIPADCIEDSADSRELGVLVTGVVSPPSDGKPRGAIRRALGRLLGGEGK